jgi:hypothetical protein
MGMCTVQYASSVIVMPVVMAGIPKIAIASSALSPDIEFILFHFLSLRQLEVQGFWRSWYGNVIDVLVVMP